MLVTELGMFPSLMELTDSSLDLVRPGCVASIQLGSFVWDLLSLLVNHFLTWFPFSPESEMSQYGCGCS